MLIEEIYMLWGGIAWWNHLRPLVTEVSEFLSTISNCEDLIHMPLYFLGLNMTEFRTSKCKYV